jgi:AsmA protein
MAAVLGSHPALFLADFAVLSMQPGRFSLGHVAFLYGVIGMPVSAFGPFKLPFAEALAKEHYRYAIAGVLVVLMIIPAIIVVFILSFNANHFKTQIIQYVKNHTQRELVLQGDIKITFFPKLGLDTGKMLLSQRNSAREFASVNDARLYVAWLPLLRKQLVFDHVEVDGARVNLIRYKNGTTNYDDLQIRDENLAPFTFDIDGIRVTHSAVNWQDEMRWQRVALQDVQIDTGRLAESVPGNLKASFHLRSEVARSDSVIDLKSRFYYDRKAWRYEFADIEGTLGGTALNFATASGEIVTRKIEARIAAEQAAKAAAELAVAKQAAEIHKKQKKKPPVKKKPAGTIRKKAAVPA